MLLVPLMKTYSGDRASKAVAQATLPLLPLPTLRGSSPVCASSGKSRATSLPTVRQPPPDAHSCPLPKVTLYLPRPPLGSRQVALQDALAPPRPRPPPLAPAPPRRGEPAPPATPHPGRYRRA